MMNNPFTRMSDQQIDQYLHLHQGDPGFIIMLSQAQAAKAMHGRMKNAAGAGAPQQTVKDSLMAGLPSVPNGQQMAETGIAAPNAMEQSPEPTVNAAGGGIIAFADKGQVKEDFSPYRKYAMQKAEIYKLDPKLVDSIFQQESGYNPNARNPNSSATGIGQLVKKTGNSLGLSDEDFTDPYKNIDASLELLRTLNTKYQGNPEKIAMAYHDGETVANKHLAANKGNVNRAQLEPEAQDYLAKTVGSTPKGLASTAPAKRTLGYNPPTREESDREAIGNVFSSLGNSALDRAKDVGAATYDVGTLIPRAITGAAESAIVRPLNAFGAKIPYLPTNAFYDSSSMTPMTDALRRSRGETDEPQAPQAPVIPNFGGPDHAQMAAAFSRPGPAPSAPNPDYALTSRPMMAPQQRERAETPAATPSQMDQLNEIMSGLNSGDVLDDSRKSLAEMKAKIAERQSKFSPMDQALMSAGFALAGSRSPHLGVGLGEAGLKGLGAYTGAMAGQNASDLEMMKLQDVQTKYESALRRGDMRLAGELLNQRNQMAHYTMQDEAQRRQVESLDRFHTGSLANQAERNRLLEGKGANSGAPASAYTAVERLVNDRLTKNGPMGRGDEQYIELLKTSPAKAEEYRQKIRNQIIRNNPRLMQGDNQGYVKEVPEADVAGEFHG
jgi:soluble lytic murein transglycosylase-like protein